jgi:uncharacterized membrane protein
MSAMSAEIKPSGRIAAIDVARGLALLAMAIYHLAWDLEFFGYAPPGMTAEGGWKLFARLIAGSFLFLVGFSLVLAHGRGIRWRPFAIRLAMVCVAALAITVATWFATPDRFIFFGILHCIAVSTVVALLFLRVPAIVSAATGIAIIVFSPDLASPWFNHPGLLWLGLSTEPVQSNDYVPLFPWFGPVLLGVAAARFSTKRDLLSRVASIYRGSGSLNSGLIFAGRHSLAVYLLHQPILIAAVYAFSLVAPATPPDPITSFIGSCNRGCSENNESTFCSRFCACTVDKLIEDDLLDAIMTGGTAAQSKPEVRTIAQFCTAEAFKETPSQ